MGKNSRKRKQRHQDRVAAAKPGGPPPTQVQAASPIVEPPASTQAGTAAPPTVRAAVVEQEAAKLQPAKAATSAKAETPTKAAMPAKAATPTKAATLTKAATPTKAAMSAKAATPVKNAKAPATAKAAASAKKAKVPNAPTRVPPEVNAADTHDPLLAAVYKWAASVGLVDGKKLKELLAAVQDIRQKRRESHIVTFWLPNGEERYARVRVAEGKLLLKLIPEDEAFPAEGYSDFDPYNNYDFGNYDDMTDIVAVDLNDRTVAMFDRNGMKWDTALQALIRDGEITLSAEQKKLVQMEVTLKGHPAWFRLRRALSVELEAWLAAGRTVLKAARAKAGEGKTSSIKADYLQTLAKCLGKKVEIPPNSRDAYQLEKALKAEYDTRKQNGTLLPTDNQVAFATDLASRCNIEVPAEALATSKACSDFIEHHKKIVPPSERQLQRARSIAGDKPLPDSVLTNSIACSDWISSHDRAGRGAPTQSPPT